MELLLAPLGAGLLAAPAWIVARRMRMERWTLTVLAAAVLAWSGLVVIALTLSSVGAFQRWPVLAAEGLICVTVMAITRTRPPTPARLRELEIRRRLLAAARGLREAGGEYQVLAGLVAISLAVSLLLAIAVAPNNPDALSYHLSRAAYWAQEGSVLHFHGASPRQGFSPPNGEIPIAWLIVLTDRDVFVQLVQYLASVLSMIGVYEGARLLRFGHAPSLLAALLFGCLPQAVLQASSAQNDLTTTVAILTAVLFGARGLRNGRSAELAVSALALGLALGTKTTAVIALPAIALLLIGAAWNRAPARRVATLVVGAVLAAALLAAPNYVQNYRDYGNILAPSSFINSASGVGDQPLSGRPAAGEQVPNLVRLLWSAFVETAPVDAPWLGDPLARAGEAVAPFARTAEPTAQKTELTFDFTVSGGIDEDETGYGLLGLLVLLPCWGYALLRSSRAARVLALAALGAIVTLALVFRYSVSTGRIMLPYVALAAPLLAIAAASFGRRVAAIGIAGIVVLPVVLLNPSKPLLPFDGETIFDLDRGQQMARRSDMSQQLKAIDSRLPADAALGVRMRDSDSDYPLFGKRFERRLLRVVPGVDDERRGIVAGQHVKAIYYSGYEPPAGSGAIALPRGTWLVMSRPARAG